jgi:hypothetical protein
MLAEENFATLGGTIVAREPCQKGTSVLPVVAALKAHPDRERLVPKALWKYFDSHLLVSGWYPERDYFVLLEALVRTMDPKAVGGDVWRSFAKFSVRHDIAGGKDAATGRTGKAVYGSFASSGGGDPEQLFRRGTKLWRQYHDTGTMRIVGKRTKTGRIVMQLVDFHIPIEGFVRLQGHYLEEYGRVVGVELESRVTLSTARGDPYCEWEHALGRTPATDAYLASLSEVP